MPPLTMNPTIPPPSSTTTTPLPSSPSLPVDLTNGFELIFKGLTTQPTEGEECASLGSRFHAAKPPKITLSQYFARIRRYCQTPSPILIVSLIYLYRVIASCGKSFVNKNTIHRLVMLSVVVACKFCDDFLQTNSFYARVGGVPLNELNALEVEFLALLDFDLNVGEPEYLGFEKFVRLAAQANAPVPACEASSPTPTPTPTPTPSPVSSTPSTPSPSEEKPVVSEATSRPWLAPLVTKSLNLVGFTVASAVCQ